MHSSPPPAAPPPHTIGDTCSAWYFLGKSKEKRENTVVWEAFFIGQQRNSITDASCVTQCEDCTATVQIKKRKEKKKLRSSWPDFVGILPTRYLWLVFILYHYYYYYDSKTMESHTKPTFNTKLSKHNFRPKSLATNGAPETPKYAGFYESFCIYSKYLLPPSLLPPFNLL